MSKPDFQAELNILQELNRDLRAVEILMEQMNQPGSEAYALLQTHKTTIQHNRDKQLARVLRLRQRPLYESKRFAASLASVTAGLEKLVSKFR